VPHRRASPLLPLPSPWALAAGLRAPAGAARLLAEARAALAEPAPAAAARLRALEAGFGASAELQLPEDTGTPLTRDEVRDFDRRFEVRRDAGDPGAALLHGLVIALRRFVQLCAARPALWQRGALQRAGYAAHIELLARCTATVPGAAAPAGPRPTDAEAQLAEPIAAWTLWQGLHWTFFIDVQGLLLSLLRFDAALAGGDDAAAVLELDTAAALLLASGNAMQLAADFAPQVYEHVVRPAMMPPHVASDRFSGLMVWDHARLVRLWQQQRARFAALPEALRPAHARFVQAYRDMMDAHRGVCARFAGDSGASLRSRGHDAAVQTLQRIGHMRQDLIDPAPDAAEPA